MGNRAVSFLRTCHLIHGRSYNIIGNRGQGIGPAVSFIALLFLLLYGIMWLAFRCQSCSFEKNREKAVAELQKNGKAVSDDMFFRDLGKAGRKQCVMILCHAVKLMQLRLDKVEKIKVNLSQSDSQGRKVEYAVELSPNKRIVDSKRNGDLEKVITGEMNIVFDTASGTWLRGEYRRRQKE